MHKSSINLGGQSPLRSRSKRASQKKKKKEGLPRPLCLAQLLCSAEKDNQSREVTAQSPTACQGRGVWLINRWAERVAEATSSHCSAGQRVLRARSQPAQRESAGELEHQPGVDGGGCHLLPLPSGWQRSPEWLSAPNPLSAGPEPRNPLTGPHCSLVPTTERKPGNYR